MLVLARPAYLGCKPVDAEETGRVEHLAHGRDFAHIHTKNYAANLVTSVFKYDGVEQRRAHSELPELVERNEEEVEDQSAIADGDDGTADFAFAKPQKEKNCHGFRRLQKRIQAIH